MPEITFYAQSGGSPWKPGEHMTGFAFLKDRIGCRVETRLSSECGRRNTMQEATTGIDSRVERSRGGFR